MARDERPVAAVPARILWLLAVALGAQIAWRAAQGNGAGAGADLPPPPAAGMPKAASLGETAALSRVAMVWLQAFDSRGDNNIPYQQLDYDRLVGWLRAILATDPRSLYPLFAAARVYAENEDPVKMRRMLAFIYEEFGADPDLRWPALAHAALLAKHRLADLPLARRYAAAIQRQTSETAAPLWARQMEVFILEDMNELEAARVMLGGLLATDRIKDPAERRFLEGRLKELEARVAATRGPKGKR